MSPLDYSSLKSIASKAGLSPREVLALAPQNDPFYVGAPGQREKAYWFKAIYEAMGSPARCHIRRVHYWLVTTNAVAKPNGKPYENTQNDWCVLNLAAKYARYLELVPIENIIDRRNPDPIVNAQHWQHQTPKKVANSIDEDSIIESIVEQFWCYNPSKTQAYVVELWAEKSTMNDVLEPVCQLYGLNLVTGLGELSITAVYQLALRIIEAEKPVRIFYISDFDPAGECMPVSVARKIEYFSRTYNLTQDIKLTPLMLTSAQCVEYNLPRTPIKETERRKDGFESRHGVGATELDAMEALHPGEMRRIIEEAIDPYFDVDAWNGAVRKNREVQDKVREYLVGGECQQCDGTGLIEGDRACPRCDGLGCKECESSGLEHYTFDCGDCVGAGSISGKIGTDILTDLNTSEFDSYTPPVAEEAVDADDSTFLYSSSLSYVDQLELYRAHKTQGAGSSDTENLDLNSPAHDLYSNEDEEEES